MVSLSVLKDYFLVKSTSPALISKSNNNNITTTTTNSAIIELKEQIASNKNRITNGSHSSKSKMLPQNSRKPSGSFSSPSSNDKSESTRIPTIKAESESPQLYPDIPLTNFPENYLLLRTFLVKKLGINVNNEKSVFELHNFGQNSSQIKTTVLNSSDTVYLPLGKINSKQFRFLPSENSDFLDYTTRNAIMSPSLIGSIPQSYLPSLLDDFDDYDSGISNFNSIASNGSDIGYSFSTEQYETSAKYEKNSVKPTKLHTFVIVVSTSFNCEDIPFNNFQFKLSLKCKLNSHCYRNVSQDSEIKKDKFFDEFTVSELVQNIDFNDYNYFIPNDDNYLNDYRNSKKIESVYSNLTGESELNSFNSSTSSASSVFSDGNTKNVSHENSIADPTRKIIFGKNSSLPVRTFYKDSAMNQCSKNDKTSNIRTRLSSGDYVFVVPVRFDSNVPETIVVPNGNLQCNVSISFQQIFNSLAVHRKRRDSFNSIMRKIMSNGGSATFGGCDEYCIEDYERYKKLLHEDAQADVPLNSGKDDKKSGSPQLAQINNYFNLPLIRGSPPADFEFNKSIIISKTFRNYFHYDVFVPVKYIPLNTEIPISIRFLPFMKQVQITSVKISIVERIYYKRRNQEDYSLKTFTAPLAIIRNNDFGSRALREDIFDNGILKSSSYPHGIDLDKELIMKIPVFVNGIDSSDSQFSRDPKVKVSPMKKFIKSLGINNNGNDNQNNEKSHISRNSLQNENPVNGNGSLFKKPDRRFSNVSMMSMFESKSEADNHGVSSSEEDDENSKLPLDYQTQKKNMNMLMQEAVISRSAIRYGYEDYSARRKVHKSEKDQIDFEDLNETIPTLHPDSISFESIKVSHSLQICIKASHCEAIESKDNKKRKKDKPQTKHTKYAIFIDTGVVLLSNLCEDNNLQLPKYKEKDERHSLTTRNEMVQFGKSGSDADYCHKKKRL